MTNCFSKIALVIIRENKTKNSTNLAAILKTESRHCYNHLAVIIARENEVLDQSARAIFDSHQCNFTKGGIEAGPDLTGGEPWGGRIKKFMLDISKLYIMHHFSTGKNYLSCLSKVN